MAEDFYRRRTVDAILLETSGAARREIRDEYLMVLTNLLGESPSVNRSDDPRIDIATIVAWCANRPDGLRKLVDAVATVEENTASVERLLARLAVGAPVRVLHPEERELVVSMLDRLDPQTRLGLLRDLVERWGPRHRPGGDPRNLVELLEDSIAEADQPHPLNVFLARLARLPELAHSEGSDELVALAGAVGDRTGSRVDPPDLPPPPERYYLVVQLTPDGHNTSRYLMSAWLTTDDGPWEVRPTPQEPQSLANVRAEVDELLHRLAENAAVEMTDLFVEFIVPRALLGADLDQWIVTAPGYSDPIGVHFPVGVRDLSRMRNRLIRGRWRMRCTWVDRNGHATGGTHFEPPRTPGPRFAEFLRSPDKACVVVLGPAAEHVPGKVGAWLGAGIPVIVWCRDDGAAERFNTETRSLLEAHGINALPQAVWRLRQDAGGTDASNHVGRHITLIWDFVHRLPPDYTRPLVSPADV